MTSPRILAAVTETERETFFPGRQFDELKGLASSFRHVDPLTLDEAAWVDTLSDFRPEILVACWRTPPLPDDILCRLDNSLRYACYLAGSVRKLVSDKLLHDGLIVTNWGHSISRTVAECGLMMAIASLRRVPYWNRRMYKGDAWKTPETASGSLFGRRVGLHGFGVIAREFVKLVQPFGVPVETYSPSVPDSILEEFNVSRSHSLEALFSENDVIIELAALTPETARIVKEEHLRSIPEGGVFVNIGRGATVDEDALARVAAEGKIFVALDVFSEEPLPADSPFRKIENVLLLPHLGGPTTDRRQDAGAHALENIRRYIRGEKLRSVVTAEVYARAS